MKLFLIVVFLVILTVTVYKFHNRRERFRKKVIQLNNKNKKGTYK